MRRILKRNRQRIVKMHFSNKQEHTEAVRLAETISETITIFCSQLTFLLTFFTRYTVMFHLNLTPLSTLH